MAERMSQMLSEKQIQEIMDGKAYLEYLGNLFEYVDKYYENLAFAALNDGRHFEMPYERMLRSTDCDIQYKENVSR